MPQGVDCSKAACQKECTCSLSKCADSINTCLADATCAKGQGCALGCACGDTACALKCAAANPSPKAVPVAQCITKNCASEDVSAIRGFTGGVDCSKSACEKECKCSLDKCADSINTCLADATCAKGQGCALACPCSDTACSLKCAAENPSSKALPVATCINKNCASSAEAVGAVDCSTSACPDQCECSLDKCADSINTCLADATCAQGQACALACACSDTACSLKCAAANPSSKALPVATCINKNCATVDAAAIDCSTAACPDQCQCGLDK